jgi:hypothetical protein
MGVLCNAHDGPHCDEYDVRDCTERCQEVVCDIEPPVEVHARHTPVHHHTPVYVPPRPVHHHHTPVYVPPPIHYSPRRSIIVDVPPPVLRTSYVPPVHHHVPHLTSSYVPPPVHVHHPAPVHVPVVSRHSLAPVHVPVVSHHSPVHVHHPAPVHVPVLTSPYRGSLLGHPHLAGSQLNANAVFERNSELRKSLGMPPVAYL